MGVKEVEIDSAAVVIVGNFGGLDETQQIADHFAGAVAVAETRP